MIKFLTALVLLVSPIVSDPKPDLMVPATITGVSTGSLDTFGNIVANVDRIMSTLNQFYSIVQSLYFVESPEFSQAADNFRYVMDSLVEAGGPIFQALANVAKVSSGNVTKAFGGIQADIKNAVGLNTEHLQLVNQTRSVLGANTTAYFDTALNQLASNLGNVSDLLSNIQTAIVEIQRLDSKSQAAIKPLLPNSDIQALNAVLRQYIQIGDAAIPEIRSVVTRVRTVDSFKMRLRTVVDQQLQYLNATYARIPSYLQTNVINRLQTSVSGLRSQVVDRTTKAAVALSSLRLDNMDELRLAANRTVSVLQELAANVSSNAGFITQRVQQLVISDTVAYLVLNHTERLINAGSRDLSLAVTQRLPNADSCYARYNYDFDRIPRTVYTQLYNCLWDTASDLMSAAANLNYINSLALIDLNNGLLAVERCTGLVTTNAPEMTKLQAATCLDETRSYLDNRRVYVQQMANYQRLLENEVAYSAQRYEFCLASTARQAYAQVSGLSGSINRCLNIAPTLTPMRFRIGGKVTIRFGK